MQHWQTTLGGAMAALGAYLVNAEGPAWLRVTGQVLQMVGALVMGIFAPSIKPLPEKPTE